MKRLAALMALAGMLVFPATAAAYPGENRNPNGVGAGPHCHFVNGSTTIVYPSHKAHDAQLRLGPAGAVFAAVPGTSDPAVAEALCEK